MSCTIAVISSPFDISLTLVVGWTDTVLLSLSSFLVPMTVEYTFPFSVNVPCELASSSSMDRNSPGITFMFLLITLLFVGNISILVRNRLFV